MIQDFALEVRKTREASGLSQKDAAQLLNITQSALSKIEQGKQMPKLREICALSIIYGRTYECLFGDLIDDIRADMAVRVDELQKCSPNSTGNRLRTETLNNLCERLDCANPFGGAI